ncbi:MAG: hypothetical protein EXQ55_01670 [Acidobacteria bacterium]|nr:hypothetical protein [Acidobacteriota bacterium]
MRTDEIRPPSLRTETLNVLKAGAAVVVIVAAYLFRPSFGSDTGAAPSAGLLPYQTLVGDVPADQQRTFRELQEGLLEAERMRSTTGRWPDVAALAEEGIPPFAADPTRKGPSYKWTSIRQDWVINYLGVPSNSSAPAWVLVLLEPEPGVPPDTAPRDETHHRLPDGTTLHVSIWTVPEEKRGGGFSALRLPQNEGWTQLMVGGGGNAR